AWILAANGKRVLAVDWDLEAPDSTGSSTPSSTRPPSAPPPG
ncbi:hypothetical protein GA0115253_104447, partial [Streptomyces sp. Termitarium-T10T-6]